ncbi:MAG TPA: hypothetical protein ENJ53_09750 [Phaeodactylibacter sp.]|nr:hypothetical protein [Phaeodactylibacter sp.]
MIINWLCFYKYCKYIVFLKKYLFSRPPSAVRRPSSVVRRPSSAVRRLPSVVCRPRQAKKKKEHHQKIV